MVKPIYEFVLWDNCSNSCSFCWQKKHCKNLTTAQKHKVSDCIIEKLASADFVKGSHILLIGGELFDSAECDEMLLALFRHMQRLMQDGTVDLLYFNTNLLHTNDQLLESILRCFQTSNLFQRLKFTTSYDIEGRFRSEAAKNEWLDRLVAIRQKFPDLPIVINSILTKQLCESIVSRNFNPVAEFKKHNCQIAVLPYVPVDVKLTPTRQQVFAALRAIEATEPGYLEPYIKLLDTNQPRIVMKFDGEKLVPKSAGTAKCGHCENLSIYSTGKTCFVCDLKTVFSDLL